MKTPYERYLDLVALGAQDNEEGRTAAHLAFKLAKKHGFELPRDPAAPMPPKQESAAQAPATVNPGWEEKKRALAGVVLDETISFLKTLNVLPKAPHVGVTQLVNAPRDGRCPCGASYRRGELVSRDRPVRCAKCVAKSL